MEEEMDGGRKPKRRIIDSTSVPNSRRASAKQRESLDETKRNRESSTLADAILVSSSEPRRSGDISLEDRDKTRVPNVIPKTSLDQAEYAFNSKQCRENSKLQDDKQNSLDNVRSKSESDVDARPSDALFGLSSELQETTKKHSETGQKLSETDHKQSETDQKQSETYHEQPKSGQKQFETDNQQTETDQKHSESDHEQPEIDQKHSETVLKMNQRNDAFAEQSGTVIGLQMNLESETNLCTHSLNIKTQDSSQKSLLQIDPTNDSDLRTHERCIRINRTKVFECNKQAPSSNPLDVKYQNSKENECYGSKETKDDLVCDTKFEICYDKMHRLNQLEHPKYAIFGENKITFNQLEGIPEECCIPQGEPYDLDCSNLFENKNILSSIDEISENNIVAEMINREVKIKKPVIIVSDFFGDDDVLSSIRHDSSVDSDLLDKNLVCHRGLSLFDEPKVIKENSQTFQFFLHNSEEKLEIEGQKKTNYVSPGTKDPFSIELEMTTPLGHGGFEQPTLSMADLYDAVVNGHNDRLALDVLGEDEEVAYKDVYSSLMEGSDERPRLLSVEEKWKIIFNEKTRAPIYAVTQYIEYLNQFVNGRNAASRDNSDVIKKDSIHPISYLLRKLKLDLKMSYDSFVEEFIKPSNNGMSLLIKLLKSIQNTGGQQSGSTNMAQLKNYKKTLTDEHDCLLCIKYSLRLKSSLTVMFDINYGLETVAMAVISTFTKSRGTAIEILTLSLSVEEGFSRTLDCFTYIQLKIGEPVRFKSLVNMMNMDSHHNTIFKLSTMKFLNSLLDASTNTNIRVFLQHELETAGLDIDYMQQKATGTGLEFDDLRHELTEWKRKYVNVDTILSQRESVAQRALEPANKQMIDELQTQLNEMSADKAYLEYQLQAVSTELRTRYEELLKRTPIKQNAYTQSDIDASKKSVACQCDSVQAIDGESDAPLRTAADYFGWKDVYTNGAQDAFYPECEHAYPEQRNVDEMEQSQEVSLSDDEGVVKVQHWLRSHCGSSENEKKQLPEHDDPTVSECSSFYFKRNSLNRRKMRKTEFPGNWKLIPKSIEQFPSRFPQQNCHQTNCDRCDLRNRPENSDHKPTSVMQNFALEVRLNDLVKTKKRSDVRSQSSDSAIGGSGEERPWTERRIPLVPVEPTEEEILQDLIQPDDSASACPTSEPYPDYSVVDSKFGTQKSFRTELSQVLREFEGNLLEYETPAKTKVGAKENYITLGEI